MLQDMIPTTHIKIHHRFFASKANTLLLLTLMFLVVVLTQVMLLNENIYQSFREQANTANEPAESGLMVPTIKLY